MTTPSIAPEVTRHPLPDPRTTSAYACAEVSTVGDPAKSLIVGHVWRNTWRDRDALHVTYDVTLDGIGAAASDGLGDDPRRLRELAAVAAATADELALALSVARHPAGTAR